MKTFAIKDCPICKSQLKLFYSGNERKYYCSKLVENTITSHYQIIIATDGTITQRTTLPPYVIKSVAGSGRSKIYKMTDDSSNIGTQDILNFVMETPMIVPEDPDKMLKRIKNLIIFS